MSRLDKTSRSSKAKQNSSANFEEVLDKFIQRRGFLKSTALMGAAIAVPGCAKDDELLIKKFNSASKVEERENLSFSEVAHGLDETLTVPEGYRAEVLIRWGDPIFDGVSAFDPLKLDEQEQLKRFGFNNDFIGFLPYPFASENSARGLLVVNHEYVSSRLMFPGSPQDLELTEAQVETEIAAHGLSVFEVQRDDRGWSVNTSSRYNRRITPNTSMRMSGPAAGSNRLKTLLSQDGVRTLGTYGNCAGGLTPWGTILTGEENVDGYFSGDIDACSESENYRRFGVRRYKSWGEHKSRWNLDENPNELLHVGWIVEIDPYDPNSTPKKRTALGRVKHEGCNVHLNKDGRVVAYTGDDARFEYIYKFVSKARFDPRTPRANMDLLDEGTLYVARFEDDGRLEWLPMNYGDGPLTEKSGFRNQGDVCLDTRKAADLLGATPMDRPEDVEVNPNNGRVYAMLTNNSERKAGQLNAANPRAHNGHGQIVEFWPEDGDHANTRFQWDMFLLAGKPSEVETLYHADISASGWLSCPDNCAFDDLGNLWIASDGAEKSGVTDGLWVCEVAGPRKALTKRFLRTPKGSELCGPFFTPDAESLFVSIQHPGAGGSFDAPSTRWPDFSEDMPARPSVVVITKEGGGRVGS